MAPRLERSIWASLNNWPVVLPTAFSVLPNVRVISKMLAMKSPFEVYLDYVAEQKCLLCPEKIGLYPYHIVADQEGFAHAECLDQYVSKAA